MQQVSTLSRAGVLLACASFLAPDALRAQDAPADTVGTLSVTGYADAYYASFSGDYAAGELVEFFTMSSRANTFGLNAAGVAVAYAGGRLRGNAEVFFGEVQETAWGAGNYLKNANVGYELAPGLWLDAGFFSTYVGVESALPKDNVFSSVAVSTFQEPYFHSGAKLAWEGTDNLALELWVMNQFNGYTENNKAKTIGAVARYTFGDDYTLSYTGTFGRETAGPKPTTGDAAIRLYNNVNFLAAPSDKVELILNASYFTETNSVGEQSDEALTGVNGMGTVRYFVSDRFAVAARGSFASGDAYAFATGGELATGTVNDFGLSLQLLPSDNAYVRLEGRTIGAENEVFGGADPSDRRFDLVLSAGVNLSRDWNFLKK